MFALSKFRVSFIRETQAAPRRLHSSICPQQGKMVVTVIDAKSATAQHLALLLKQDPNIEELRLFSREDMACGVAMDISAIDTRTRMRAFTGPYLLRDAILGARIVVLVGGLPIKPCLKQVEIYKKNLDQVRTIAMYLAEFNPTAVFCIAMPPVNVFVPLVSEEYKKASVYDPRKIIGVTTVSLIRANTLAAKHAKVSPESMVCPVIGGLCSMTSTAVISQAKPPCAIGPKAAEIFQNFLGDAEDYVLRIREKEKSGPLSLVHALATARFVNSMARALNGAKNCVECAFVRQTGHICKFLKYMASIVVLGRHGVKSCHMPKLNEAEAARLRCAHTYLMQQDALGRSVATGGISMQEQKRCMKKKLKCDLVLEGADKKKKKRAKKKKNQGQKHKQKAGEKAHVSQKSSAGRTEGDRHKRVKN